MFDVGFWELVILFGLGLMVLGPERMPKVAAKVGRWAGQARRMARNLSNQFELPVLFFAACLSLFVTGGAGLAAIVAAWAFVLARVVHAYVHLTSNRVRIRRRLFIVSLAVNLVQWLLLAIHIA